MLTSAGLSAVSFKEIYLLMGDMLQRFMNNNFFSLNYQRLTTATTIMVFAITLLTQMLLAFEIKGEITILGYDSNSALLSKAKSILRKKYPECDVKITQVSLLPTSRKVC